MIHAPRKTHDPVSIEVDRVGAKASYSESQIANLKLPILQSKIYDLKFRAPARGRPMAFAAQGLPFDRGVTVNRAG